MQVLGHNESHFFFLPEAWVIGEMLWGDNIIDLIAICSLTTLLMIGTFVKGDIRKKKFSFFPARLKVYKKEQKAMENPRVLIRHRL